VPFWRQNPNPNMRTGTAPTRDYYPLSETVFEPAEIPPSMENPGTTLPSDGYSAEPNYVAVNVSFGRHDALGGRLMEVSQADLYQSAIGPFPRAGTWEEPGAAVAVLQMVRLQPTTSAHPGLNLATGPGPNMLYIAPPVFSVQTQPIIATGL
jgi:hypothetical protein